LYDTIATSPIRRAHPTLWKNLTFALKGFHSIVFLSFIFSDFMILYSGITGHYPALFYVAVVIMTSEMITLYFNNWRCPLTKLALAMGDETGDDLIGDYVMPKQAIPYVTPTLGIFFLTGIILNVLQMIIAIV
jgi:hypothetical protein